MSKVKKHDFSGKVISWLFCTRCGLITLKNAVSRKAMSKPCTGSDEDD